MQQFTDAQIGEHKYRIGQFTASVGSWILLQVMTKIMAGESDVSPHTLKHKFEAGLPSIQFGMKESEFENIQAHCLSVCCRYDNGAPMPIFVYETRLWAYRDLEYDLPAVMALMIHALKFNLAPFFLEGGLSRLLASFSTLKSPSTQA